MVGGAARAAASKGSAKRSRAPRMMPPTPFRRTATEQQLADGISRAELKAGSARDWWLNTHLGLNTSNVSHIGTHRVLIWHDERMDGHLSFMLYPVVATLVAGFRNALGWQIRAGVGRSMRLNHELSELRSGDLFIWVGPFSLTTRPSMPFRRLRARGVRTVLYSTEPRRWCPYRTKLVDEVWDFGWAGLEGCMTSCQQRFPEPFNGTRYATFECIGGVQRDSPMLTLRFIPPGYLPPPPEPAPSAVRTTRLAVGTGSACARLRFLGAIDHRHRLQPGQARTLCFDKLRAVLHERLVQTYDAWEDEPLAQILHTDQFYLNLHKGCEAAGRSPVTFRVSRILSMPGGRMILSERCHPFDEAEFNGTVHFMPQEAIPSVFDRLCHSEDEWRAEARRAHEVFRERFEPRHLFQEAGIYRLLQHLVARGTRSVIPRT